MAIGIYKAFKRSHEINRTTMFTNNLQIWLALLSISLLGFLELIRAIWGWWMFNLTPIGWFFYILGSVMLFFFLAMSIRSLFGFLKLMWHGKFGQRIEYDPQNTDPNILKAITPIEADNNLKDYKKVLALLVKSNNEVIKKNNELISEYQAIITRLEAKHKNKG
jgi:hypothetical protein